VRFSVVICTHNRAQVLKQTLGFISQLEVADESGWELVIVDNASTDETAAAIKEFASRTAIPVQYVHESRLGHSFALNSGIKACRGELIAFTDDDAAPFPDWLRHLDRTLVDGKIDAVFGKAIPLWEGGKAPAWFSPRFNPNFALLDYGPNPFEVHDIQKPFFGVNHCWRREALEALGGYREGLGLFGAKGGTGNDIDLLERALAAGRRVVYNPDAVVRHMIPAGRCQKAHHRRAAWGAAEFFYPTLKQKQSGVPWLLGLPRFFYRMAVIDLVAYLRATLGRKREESFYRELKLIRFLGLGYQAWRHQLRRGNEAGPAGAARAIGAV
jgi:glycosyltransferase involved in cell wall biosynthesis